MASMKSKMIVLFAASMFAVNAHATKARVGSLLGAKHVIDSQSIFNYPSEIGVLGQYVTFEFGPTGQGTGTKAEGGLFRKVGDGTLGLYLGHHSASQASFRALAGATYLNQDNPVNVFYGQGNWGLSVGLSTSEKKTTSDKETTVSVGFGQSLEALTWSVNVDAVGTAENAAKDKWEGAPVLNASVRTNGDVYYHAGVTSANVKSKPNAGAETKIESLGLEVGVVDRSLKNDTTDLYYGVSVRHSNTKIGKDKTRLDLPVVIGLEHNLNSWAVLRGSVQQNVLLGSTEDKTAATPGDKADSIANNTQVAAGLGLKYGSVTLDGTLAAATSGDVNGNAVLANAGLIYSF